MSENEIKPVAWPEYLMLRDTKIHDDSGGLGHRIYTTAGAGFEKRKYISADLFDRLTAERDDWRRQAWHETDVAAVAVQEVERLTAERDSALAALDRIVSLKMSMFKDPYDMIGEFVNIAADAIDSVEKGK